MQVAAANQPPTTRKVKGMQWIAIVGIVVVALSSCAPPEKSPTGFRLPEGEEERGAEAFLKLRCNACHTVRGLDLPDPVAAPGFAEERLVSGSGSRMPDYSDFMTVRELVDLVAFLHSRYEYAPPSLP